MSLFWSLGRLWKRERKRDICGGDILKRYFGGGDICGGSNWKIREGIGSCKSWEKT